MVSSLTTNGLKRRLEDWNQINWRKINKLVRNLRQRIFRARKLGNFRRLRNLQKLMQRSYANLLLSVRRITQTNQGKATAGIDPEVVNTPASQGDSGKQLGWGKPQTNPEGGDTKTQRKKTTARHPDRARQNRTGNSKEFTLNPNGKPFSSNTRMDFDRVEAVMMP